jgi:hypothetical protein
LYVSTELSLRLYRATRYHAVAIAFLGALTVAWTWPLVLHLTTAVPGGAGDNYTFLWTLWWMRRALSDATISFFETNYLFFPFGTNLVNQSHYALPAFAGATILGSASLVFAQNAIVLAHTFLNAVVMYGFAWDMTRHRRASILAGVLFGTSPYLASHFLGHFELLAAWPLPAFAWALRRAFRTGSTSAVAAASVVLIATAYTTYYYVVYLGLLALTWFVASPAGISLALVRRPPAPRIRIARRVLTGVMAAVVTLILWILATGGAVIPVRTLRLSLTGTHNPLAVFWFLSLCLLLTSHRIVVHFDTTTSRIVQAAVTLAIATGAFLIGTAPLLIQAIQLVRTGQYVSQQYYWRSAPAGVDLLSLLLGHPFHPLFRDLSRQLYALAGTDIVESVAWIGVVPCVLLLFQRVDVSRREEARCWWIVAIVFVVWALGPNLMIGGIDAGLPLPQTLARFVPFVSNARIPGRAMVGVYLAIGVLVALRMSAATGFWARPGLQWALIGGLTFEYMASPVTLTPLTSPAPYKVLAAAPAGGVCHVPFIMGDGLRTFGPYDLSVNFHATQHQHPIAGGFLSRMPPNSDARYAAMPIAGDLLALAAGRPAQPFQASPERSPCDYLVVERAKASRQSLDYIGTLPLEPLSIGDGLEVYVVRTDPP